MEFLGSLRYLLSGLNLLSVAINSLSCVFLAPGLYAIAKRRSISKPWMAWIPVVNAYLMGGIADRYNAEARGIKNTRMAMTALVLCLLMMVYYNVERLNRFIMPKSIMSPARPRGITAQGVLIGE